MKKIRRAVRMAGYIVAGIALASMYLAVILFDEAVALFFHKERG